MQNKLTVSSSPHFHSNNSTAGIMLDVILALAPACIYGFVLFGWRAVLVVATCIASAMLAEFVWNKIMHKPNSLGDLSAVVTGLLLGMNLPSSLPIPMAALGSAIAIIVVKQMFGGIGQNFMNPALGARVVLLVSFPAAMTNFLEPFGKIVTSATPLAQGANFSINELLMGVHPGCIGETPALLLLIGGLYLIMRRVISPIIPVCFIGSVALLSLILGANPLYMILSGGVMLGAIFMATDYSTSPTFPLGKVIFGIGCGVITTVIRLYGSLPEGVSYSIIIMNLLVPHINTLTTPKPFGWEGKKQ